jgi:hypothetical protein
MPTGTIAYFSMEIALADHIPAYSGGLGVLAGDTVRAAADLALPMVGVTAGREIMRRAIALNASLFNAHRMPQEYVIHAYQDPTGTGPTSGFDGVLRCSPV